MKGSGTKNKTQVLNNANKVDTAMEIVGESRKISGDGGFVSDDGGGGGDGSGSGSGESSLPEMGDDRRMEDGEEEEEEEDDDDEEDEDEEEEEGTHEERPKLDEGYYEIEAIRRKRIRKVSIAFLIKDVCFLIDISYIIGCVRRGWPETANTWEPLENLQSIADVIDAFEGSLRPGKPGRKRKRKFGGPHSQMKKQQRLTSMSHDAAEKSDSSTSLNNSSLPDIPGAVDLSGSSLPRGDWGVKNVYLSNHVEANSGSLGIVRQVSLMEEEKEYDPTLNELRGPVNYSNGSGCSQGVGIVGSEGDNVRANGLLKVYPNELDKDSHFIGAKRRKSGSVKRFKQEGSTSNNYTTTKIDQNLTPDLTTLDSFGRIARIGNEYPGMLEINNLSPKTKIEELDILKILKPTSFSAYVSDNIQDVLVTFSALRSDGKEVTVDNRFLKAHNPLLLIEFYEQHLKYNGTS